MNGLIVEPGGPPCVWCPPGAPSVGAPRRVAHRVRRRPLVPAVRSHCLSCPRGPGSPGSCPSAATISLGRSTPPPPPAQRSDGGDLVHIAREGLARKSVV